MHFNNTKSAIRNMDLPEEIKNQLLEEVARDEETFKQPTKEDIMAIKDNMQRQKAIKNNLHLF